MARSASINNSTTPQGIVEKLARKSISEEEAEKRLEVHWRRAYETPTVVRFFRDVLTAKAPTRRTSK
jgi:hypothetical protein